MKILLIGLGSIGKRHLTNMLRLGYKEITVVSHSGVLPGNFCSLKVYSTIATATIEESFDAAIICTPTAQHVADLLKVIHAGIKRIYLEKPVSHSYENVPAMLTAAKTNSADVMVGYDLHYDAGLQKVKELIDSNTIGKVISINAQVGQYLPDWRPQQDYRQSMSAKKETGGGVMLDLVHEFDYLYWLLGEVESIACFYQNSHSLDIATEDIAEVLLKFKNNAIGSIHLDYLQPTLVRNCLITGSSGSIYWDLTKTKVEWIDVNKNKNEFDYPGFERNERFIQIMRDFLTNNKSELITSLEQGIESLKMVLAAKHSSEKGVFVHLNNFLNQ